MKRCVTLALATLCTFAAIARADEKAKNPNLGKVRHVVLFKFKQGTTPEQIKEVEDAFRALPGKIPQIAGFEWGTNMSPEKLDQGFTHCFLLTFADAKARDAYLPHPAHKAFGKVLRPHLDKVLVVDFVAGE
jgi:hypothetical protein